MGDAKLQELDAESRALIDLAKDLWEPLPWQCQRVGARLELALRTRLPAHTDMTQTPRASQKP